MLSSQVTCTDQPRASAKVAIIECFSTPELHRELAFAVAREHTTCTAIKELTSARAEQSTIASGSALGSHDVVRNTVTRGALVWIEEHLMSEKFDPAPLDKHAAKPGKKDPLSDKAHGELEKGLEDSGLRPAKQHFA